MTPEEILEEIGEMVGDDEEETITFPDLQDALIGWAQPWDTGGIRPTRLVYSASKCIDILMGQGMDREGAMEWLSFNTEGGYLGPGTPIVMHGENWE